MKNMLKTYIKLMINEVFLQERSQFSDSEIEQKLNNIGNEIINLLNQKFKDVKFAFEIVQNMLIISCNLTIDYFYSSRDKIWEKEKNLQPQLIQKISIHLNDILKKYDLQILTNEDHFNPEQQTYHHWMCTFIEDSKYKTSYSIDEMPSKLYHVTYEKFVESIKNNGLQPNKRFDYDGMNFSRQYNPRIYVSTSIALAKTYMESLYDFLDSIEDDKKLGKPIIIKIDTLKLPKDMIFYRDEEIGTAINSLDSFNDNDKTNVEGYHAFYITQSIPKNALSFS